MEDEKIKELLQNFQPKLASDDIFMSILRRKMESVEMVKKHHEELQHRNKIAVCVAALAGFVMGVTMTLLMPMISDWFSSIKISLPYLHQTPISFNGDILAWILASSVSAIVAFKAYEVTVHQLFSNEA